MAALANRLAPNILSVRRFPNKVLATNVTQGSHHGARGIQILSTAFACICSRVVLLKASAQSLAMPDLRPGLNFRQLPN